MEQSSSIKELATALSKAQAEFKAVPFNATNPFLKNRYADLGAIIEAARPILAKHSLTVTQCLESEGEKVGVTTLLAHSSGEWLKSTAYLPVGDEKGKSLAQVAGSVVSYLKRYGYASILGLYADEDTDGTHPAQAYKERIQDAVAVYEGKGKPNAATVAEIRQDPLSDKPYGGYVLAFKKAKELTKLDRPTLDNIAGKIGGLEYLKKLLEFEPDDPGMKRKMDEAKEAIRAYLNSGAVPSEEFKIVSSKWSQFVADVCSEMPVYTTNGEPNTWHIIGALKKMGQHEFTDDNASELIALLRGHAAEKMVA